MLFDYKLDHKMLNSKNFDFILRGCFAAVLTLIVTSCFVMQNKFSVIAPGTWRAVLALSPKQIVSSKDKEVHTVRQLLTDKTRTTEPEAVKMEEATGILHWCGFASTDRHGPQAR